MSDQSFLSKDTSLVGIDENHASSILKSLYDSWEKGMYCDLSVKVGSRLFLTHRFVLASISDYFKVYLQRDGKDQEVVTLDNIGEDVFEVILKFGYTGKLYFQNVNVEELAVSADYLGVTTLKDMCDKHLVQGVTTDNCLVLIVFSDVYRMSCLFKCCKDIWCQYFKYLVETREFLQLPTRILLTLLKDNRLKLYKSKSEYIIFSSEERELLLLKSVLKYISGNIEDEQVSGELMELLRAVKLPEMDFPLMMENLKTFKKLKNNDSILSLFTLAKLYKSSRTKEGFPSYWSERRYPMNYSIERNGPFADGGQVGRMEYAEFGASTVIDPFAYITQIKLWIRLWDGRQVIGGIQVTHSDGNILGGGEQSDRSVYFLHLSFLPSLCTIVVFFYVDTSPMDVF